MDTARLITDLKNKTELNPNSYDGSYELMRTAVEAYSRLSDFSACTYKDLNAVYMMAIGTWKHSPEKKKEYINAGCLPQFEKENICQTIDQIWDNACLKKYEHKETAGKPTFGMFGTGFYSFQNKTTDECAQNFIKMCADILNVDDEEKVFVRCAEVLTDAFKGMKAASASVVLHCLKPFVFPIINGNMGNENIFSALGVKLDKPSEIGTYISNCRRIKSFRDENLPYKNYRVLDIAAWNLEKYRDTDEYIPSLAEYDPGISTEQYIELLQNDKLIKRNWLDTIYYIYKSGGENSCAGLSSIYGNTAAHYNMNSTLLGKAVQKATGCPFSSRDEGGDRYWAILFRGRTAKPNEVGAFIWKLRNPLFAAVSSLDESGFFDEVGDTYMNIVFDKNMILYGPPGTGKTYNTVIYAVAIVENKSVEAVSREASLNYSAVKQRYDAYKLNGQIAFTTFHQSYGYEEFIEGIKPRLSEEENGSELDYTVEDGVFKRFCERAQISEIKVDNELGLNKSPVVWKVSLAGTYDNPVRDECLKNNHIRIGWDSYGEYISNEEDFSFGGRAILNAFMNKMRIGDIVLSCYSASTIDAIGIITGEYEWDDSYPEYKRVRRVKWIVKGIRENIVELNGGYNMTLSTVYQMKVSVPDVINLINTLSVGKELKDQKAGKNFVFIIDEINRGNISKIFGELITLIEPSKRLGAEEETTVTLPYSLNKTFGVPQNVYIIGTMNTADRSIALMDTALRRRFAFIEMLPDAKLLRDIGADVIAVDGETLNVADMLEIINRRIEYLYDREHTIGHAFFTGIKDNPSVEQLASIFEKSVVPLLQEYFYEDYRKIQMVLGDDGKNTPELKQFQFIRDEDVQVSDVFNTVPDFDLPPKKYTIQQSAFKSIRSYKLIAKGL